MTVTNKIKGAMELKGKSLADLAGALGISKQGLSNKFFRNSFSAEDLTKIADFLGFELCFIDNTHKVTFSLDDFSKKEAKSE